MSTDTTAGLRLVVFTDAHEVGGAEIAVATLVGALAPETLVTVVGTDPAVVARIAASRPGSATRVVPEPTSIRDLAALRALRRTLCDLRPDVFHANLNAPWSCRYAIAVARTVPGVRRVAVEQLVLSMPDRRTRIVKRITSRMLDAHVAVGDASARTLEAALGLPTGSVRTIRNAVVDRPPPSVGPTGPPTTLLALARLDPIKGLDVLVDALGQLRDVRVVVAGEGPARGALMTRAKERGVADRFVLLGWDPDGRSRLGDADIFVLPSRAEGLPLSIAEAMLAERPVIATDVGSVREVVADGVTGLLVPPDDADALATAIATLRDDPHRCRAMGIAGRTRALACFTAPRMAREFETLYRELTPVRTRRGGAP